MTDLERAQTDLERAQEIIVKLEARVASMSRRLRELEPDGSELLELRAKLDLANAELMRRYRRDQELKAYLPAIAARLAAIAADVDAPQPDMVEAAWVRGATLAAKVAEQAPVDWTGIEGT